MNQLKVKKMELGPIGTNAFVLYTEGSEDAVLVDAPPDCALDVERFLVENNLTLKAIWLTHGHWDHMAGAHELTGQGMEVIGHADDKLMFENPELMAQFSIPGLSLKPVEISRWIKEGDELKFCGMDVQIFHCPGHCPGNVVFYFKSENICFVGDVIFSGSVGRTDLPGGDSIALEHSIREKIYKLPDHTDLAVGHGPDTTVGREKISNQFVRP